MPTVPLNEPTELSAGDSWAWRREDLSGEYPADDGWTLTYYFNFGGETFSVAAKAAGPHFAVAVPAATTANYQPGTYDWRAYAAKGADRYQVDKGLLTVLPNFATATTDQRSHARKVLAMVEAVIEGRATSDVLKYQIAGRTLEKTPIGDLLKLRDRYRAEVAREADADRIAAGLPNRKRVLVRFGR